MTFKTHLNQIISRGKCTLGLMKRMAKDFDCPYVTRSLYCALVRPTLEYCSVVWDPVFKVDKERLESIQKQYLLFALRGLGWRDTFQLPSYHARLELLNMQPLSWRRNLTAGCTVVSCFNGELKCNSVASFFRFGTPARETRSSCSVPVLQLLPLARPRYVENSPMRRCIQAFNTYAHLYVPGMSTDSFKRAALLDLTAGRRMVPAADVARARAASR